MLHRRVLALDSTRNIGSGSHVDDVKTGYLKAVWPFLGGAFLRSGRPPGPGEARKSVEGVAPPKF